MLKNQRYIRQIALDEIGIIGQEKISKAKVLVIGAGGLGCPVLQNLAAAGVGYLGIVDGDIVEESNLHRQLLFTLEDCGKKKAEVAAESIRKLNPDIKAQIYSNNFKTQNALEIANSYDIIVDCSDTIEARYLINDVSVFLKIPFVYASVHKFEGQVSVFNYQNGPSYRCIFPEKIEKSSIPNCVTSGVLGVIPNLLGVMQATEVLKMILGIGDVLIGKMLVYNGLNMSTQIIKFKKNEEQVSISKQKGESLIKLKSEFKPIEINASEFEQYYNHAEYLLVDVRETNELPKLTYHNVVNMPMSAFANAYQTLDKNQKIIFFCHSGLRSLTALEQMHDAGFENISHLKRGIISLPKTLNILEPENPIKI